MLTFVINIAGLNDFIIHFNRVVTHFLMSCISSGEDDGTNLGIEQKSLSCYGIARLPATIIMMHVNTLQVHY